ncbi:hypothetical protein DPMN_040476 [Dreissena polymorpha]|uniref:Uncharacterized protein n=1 Tax=Dreissena polymorpha TaxID=45954 RepID=A0A9D4CWZ4_DREPO|nr:hypothetical protein DPMN_040476 [Dreissena polymorpha]
MGRSKKDCTKTIEKTRDDQECVIADTEGTSRVRLTQFSTSWLNAAASPISGGCSKQSDCRFLYKLSTEMGNESSKDDTKPEDLKGEEVP